MYQEVCFNRGTEAGGGGGELMWATRSAPQSFSACYGPADLRAYHLGWGAKPSIGTLLQMMQNDKWNINSI